MLSRGAAAVKIFQRMGSNVESHVSVDLAGMRKRYLARPDYRWDLTRNLLKDPIQQFDAWFQYTSTYYDLPFEELNAFALSTVNSEGRPSCRMVLIKGYSDDGFRFFTNYYSQKGRDLEENPYACLLAYWQPVNLQVRIEGITEKLPDHDADEYWTKRPAKSRASAYISQQSSVILSRESLDDQLRKANEEFTDCGLDIPRPKHWGGFILKPDRFEFWQGDNNRLHDRVRFRKPRPGEKIDNVTLHQGEGDWVYERLSP